MLTFPQLPLQRITALVLVMIAFMLSVWISRTVFERLPHLEDEVAYIYQARVFARGDVTAAAPDPYVPFWQPFVVQHDDRLFSKYTPGWSLVLALGVIGGMPWLVNASFAALTVALTYRTGEEIFGRDVGLIGAWLVTFSPMALLLNGTLMSHTAALCYAALFVYGYWRITNGRSALWWGLLAGAALGMLGITRMLTTVAIAAPFIVDAGVRVILAAWRGHWWRNLRPLLALSAVALALMLIVPAYRYLTTGDVRTNTYRLVWDYDRVGFGEGYGRNGHTLAKGLRHARFDLSLAAADLFGWQPERLTYAQRQHLLQRANTYPGRGYSWVLLPFGVVMGIFAGRWRWTVLLAAIPLAVVGAHLAYWIGSQRYSTRYYFEALSAVALLSAIPLGLLARSQWRRMLVYGVLTCVTAYTFAVYSLPRVQLLRGFNNINRQLIEVVEQRRQTDNPALVIITGDNMTWRAGGALLVETSPYLDSEIVLARNQSDNRYLDEIQAMFAGREIIRMNGEGEQAWFPVYDG